MGGEPVLRHREKIIVELFARIILTQISLQSPQRTLPGTALPPWSAMCIVEQG